MKYAIDQVHAFRAYVFCKGWFSGLDNDRGSISVLIGDREFTPDVTAVDRPDLSSAFGPGAERWGFQLACKIDPALPNWRGSISIAFNDGENIARVDRPAEIANEWQRREASDAELEFFRLMHVAVSPNVLEIGSRKRSGNAKTDRLPAGANYVGFDIAAGENVDVVGDAHFMAASLPHDHFDFVFSISTFEHLLMPWKVAVDLNKVMKTGALGFIHSHQTWPVHDAPWDFYRFSKFGWHGIFNQFTGFEVIASAQAEPATVLPQAQLDNPATYLEFETGYLMSVCLIRKVAPCALTWDADPAAIMQTAYPA
jgi:hypothetical protein